jgi:hypothetical protein
MIDETQEGLLKKEEPAWGQPAIEVKGNFSWGLINKQEDVESDDEKSDIKVDEKKKEEQTV